MNHHTIVSIGVAVAVLLNLAAVVEALHQYGHVMAKDGAPAEPHQDKRVALGLVPGAESGLKLTMREHLEADQGHRRGVEPAGV